MDFGQALRLLKDGKLAKRKGWKGMWLSLYPGHTVENQLPPSCFAPAKGSGRDGWGHVDTGDAIYMTGVAYGRAAAEPWAPMHSDLLADDWQEVVYELPEEPKKAARPSLTAPRRST